MNAPSSLAGDALFSERELAERWGCSRSSLAHLRMLPHDPETGPRWVKCGHRIRYKLSDIEEHEQREWTQ